MSRASSFVALFDAARGLRVEIHIEHRREPSAARAARTWARTIGAQVELSRVDHVDNLEVIDGPTLITITAVRRSGDDGFRP